ncbi:MAG: ATP-grasp domain-containing protein [Flavobacteriales bacterium]|jgi:biotin carboxylase|nr:ATP-grasp domain-containing protein [Flavobacteriales bacterium]
MKRLAILGASYLQEPLYRKAKEMGHFTIGFAWAEGAVCANIADKFYPISILEKDEILKVCEQENIDGILSIASDVAVNPWFYIAQKLNLPSNSINCGEICADKYKMRFELQKRNLPCPKFKLYSEPASLTFETRQIIKPIDRSGSAGVSVLEIGENAFDKMKTAIDISFAKKCIIEDFIEGNEYSVECISQNGVHTVLAITEKVTTGAPHFVETAHLQPPLNLSNQQLAKILDLVPNLLEGLNIQEGASHVEVKVDNSSVHCIEVGARMGGDFIGSDLVYLSTGYDFTKNCIRIALGEQITPFNSNKKASGVIFKSNQNTNRIDQVKNDSGYQVITETEGLFDEKLVSKSSERAGYLIYQK